MLHLNSNLFHKSTEGPANKQSINQWTDQHSTPNPPKFVFIHVDHKLMDAISDNIRSQFEIAYQLIIQSRRSQIYTSVKTQRLSFPLHTTLSSSTCQHNLESYSTGGSLVLAEKSHFPTLFAYTK